MCGHFIFPQNNVTIVRQINYWAIYCKLIFLLDFFLKNINSYGGGEEMWKFISNFVPDFKTQSYKI